MKLPSGPGLPQPRGADDQSYRCLEEVFGPMQIRRLVDVQEAKIIRTVATTREKTGNARQFGQVSVCVSIGR
jgi:hypothetical protein